MRVVPDTIVGKKIKKTNKKKNKTKKTGCSDVHTNGEKRGAEKRRRRGGRQKVEVKRRVQNRGKDGCE